MKKKIRSARPSSKVAEPIDAQSIEEIRQLAVREIFEPPEPSAEAMAGILDRLETLAPATISRLLLILAREGGEKSLPLLEREAQSPSTPVALAAVDALGAVRSQRAAELLSRMAESDPSRQLQKEAKRALFRLRGQGVVVEAPPKAEGAKDKYPAFRAIASSIDGTGSRAIIFGVERPMGGADRIAVLVNTKQGLTHCAGIDMSRRAILEEMDTFVRKPEHGSLWADLPVPYGKQLVHDALAHNPKSGTPVPRGFYYWGEEIRRPSERYERPIVYEEISPLEVKWDPTLLEQSDKLLDLHEFDTWILDPEMARRYYFEIKQAERSAVVLPGWSQKEREAAVMRRFFEEAITPEERARYKFELEEMAYLFLRHDRRLDARRSLAAAIAFEEQSGGDVIKIPFMRSLLLKTFGLIEREARSGESIDPSSLGIMTPDQFMR